MVYYYRNHCSTETHFVRCGMDFLKNNRRFSFKLDGADAWDTPYTVERSENGTQVVTVYTFDGGLRITNVAVKYEKYGVYEWVNYIENISDEPTGVVSELWDCDVELPMEHEDNRKYEAYLPDVKTATKIYAPNGSIWTRKEFYCDVDFCRENHCPNHIWPGQTREYACRGGRSSDLQSPFFDVYKNDSGYIFAIGWSGQWNCEISRTNDSICFKSKIEDSEFCVMPGERFRTSSVVIMPHDTDFAHSHNLWRRFINEEFSLLGKQGRAEYGPLCAGVWGGMKTSSVLDRIEKIKKNDLPFEYVWMDAGWYGADTAGTPDEFEGDWYMHTGDWQVSPVIHPNRLRDVSKAIHDAGMKFLLWFEPERVVKTTPIVSQHPEYLLDNGNPNDNNLLLNLGSPAAWQYCFDMLSDFIRELEIDCYRNDFNFQPLEYWRKNDTDGRRGITEIKYINGLYALWDALLERFPKLIIDDCASGGRRIDVEMLKRSVPLWRSDVMCPANYDIEAAQCNSQTFNLWMPYSGTGTGRGYDEYRFRSAYSTSMTTNHSFSERDTYCDTKEKTEFLKKYTREYLRVRPYFSEDFYPLTELNDQLDTWCAMQFDRPEKGDGLLEVFRREKSPYETTRFAFRGVDEAAEYHFEDLDGGEFTVSGKELAANGLSITVTERRKAKIYIYRAVK